MQAAERGGGTPRPPSGSVSETNNACQIKFELGLLETQDPAAQADPRTTEATWRQIGALLDRFTPHECANYLVNAGYASA
jgi:hypothetical protein